MPPPPLMRLSSAVDLVRAVDGEIERRQLVQRGRGDAQLACFLRRALEVAVTQSSFSPPRTRAASNSRKISAVEPEPRPSFIPSMTKSSAFAAAARFKSF